MSSLTGLPVVLQGRCIGHVERPMLDERGRRLRGFTVRRGLRSARWMDRAGIVVLGEVSVVVDRVPVRIPRDADVRLSHVADSAGLRLGMVTDVWLQPGSLRVEAL